MGGAGRVAVLLLLLLCAGARVGAVSWSDVSCPGATLDGSCTFANPAAADVIISLFFQVELKSTENFADVTCTEDASREVLCQRSFARPQSGSSGVCFFMLRKGSSYSCSGEGTINFIGRHMAEANGTLLGADPVAIDCLSGACKYENKGKSDLWVSAALEVVPAAEPPPAAANLSSATCHVDGSPVCSFLVNASTLQADREGGGELGPLGRVAPLPGAAARPSTYSCAYFLPAGSTLACQYTGGARATAVRGTALLTEVVKGLKPLAANYTCPNMTWPKPDLCDCEIHNPYADRDLVVAVTAVAVDGAFSSYFCYTGGAQLSSFGVNLQNRGNGGSTYIILPAGGSLTCSMQWGALSYEFVSVAAISTSIYKRQGRAAREPHPIPAVAMPGPGFVPHVQDRGELRAEFHAWMERLGRSYASEAEYRRRFDNFCAHAALVRQRLVAEGRARAEPEYNDLADLSLDEFESTYRGCMTSPSGGDDAQPPAPTTEAHWITEEDLANLPASIDWRTRGAVSAVKNQGQCGSCWSFSATGVIESAWFLVHNEMQTLSEQELVSCETNCDACGGGWPYSAIDWVRRNGIDTEASYPYASGGGKVAQCAAKEHTKAKANVTGFSFLNKTEDYMAAWLVKYGPVSIGVDAMTQLWWPYSSGIMKGCCNHAVDHAVLLVGYGEEEGPDGKKEPYWLIKNSWGASWGEQGYVRLQRGTNQCGITAYPTAAHVQGSPMPPPPPPPSPPPPPTPPSPSWQCPNGSVAHNTSTTASCVWTNGTQGARWPPSPPTSQYCEYIHQGYMGYIFPKADYNATEWPCPPSFGLGSNSKTNSTGDWFCTLENGQHGFSFPKGVVAHCDKLPDGQFSYSWPA